MAFMQKHQQMEIAQGKANQLVADTHDSKTGAYMGCGCCIKTGNVQYKLDKQTVILADLLAAIDEVHYRLCDEHEFAKIKQAADACRKEG